MSARDAQEETSASDKVTLEPVVVVVVIVVVVVAGDPDPDQKFIDVRMNAIRRKIIILSGKGGRI